MYELIYKTEEKRRKTKAKKWKTGNAQKILDTNQWRRCSQWNQWKTLPERRPENFGPLASLVFFGVGFVLIFHSSTSICFSVFELIKKNTIIRLEKFCSWKTKRNNRLTSTQLNYVIKNEFWDFFKIWTINFNKKQCLGKSDNFQNYSSENGINEYEQAYELRMVWLWYNSI